MALVVLELFAGTRSIGKAFEKHGHKVYSVEWDKSFQDIALYQDISTLTKEQVVELCGRVPDVVWASPDYSTYSLAAIGHHRKKDPIFGNLIPQTEYARFCDKTNAHVIELIMQLKEDNPDMLYFIENPVAGLRKMDFMQRIPRYTVSYCQYLSALPPEQRYRKPTDLWTNHPNPQFRPPCHNGDPCHARAPRGSRTGIQGIKGRVERSRIPEELCEHIVEICER